MTTTKKEDSEYHPCNCTSLRSSSNFFYCRRRSCLSDSGHDRSDKRVYDREYYDRLTPPQSSQPSSETSSEASISPRLGSPTLPRHNAYYTSPPTRYHQYPQHKSSSRDNSISRNASYVDSNGHHRLAPTL